MKKFITIIGCFLTFLILYSLQSNFFSWFTIHGIKPNLFILLVMFIGLFAGRTIGTVIGMFFGICLDLFIGKTVGLTGICLGLVGFLGGYFDKNFSKESRITIMLMVIGSTFIYEMILYLLNVFLAEVDMQIVAFLKIVVIEIIYNSIITIILYPIIQKVGYYVEDIFKGNNILTRYF